MLREIKSLSRVKQLVTRILEQVGYYVGGMHLVQLLLSTLIITKKFCKGGPYEAYVTLTKDERTTAVKVHQK